VSGEQPPLIVLEPVERLLDELGVGAGPLTAEPLGDGHSNVTYLLTRGDDRLVLRRPPRPPYPESAHDVIREARIVAALGRAGARVPEIVAIEESPEAIGAPFYLMRHVPGHVLTDRLPVELDSAAVRGAIGPALVDALVELHAIDSTAPELASFGRPAGYLERQLRRFAGIWEQVATRPLPEVDATHRWLSERLPDSPPPTVVHGDYRLGNVLLAPGDPVELAAILDWEMTTVGDPLADVGYLLAAWADPGDPPTPILDLSEVTRGDGFTRRADLRARYAERSGRDLAGIGWYEVLAIWKSAIFLEASYGRYLSGSTDDTFFATLGEGVPLLGRAAATRTAALE
jgi:aminoglycoside phosphotransferase (APT) family kinase protein